MSKRFEKILVANRGEIAIRVFRACYDLGLKTVAIYSKEDINSLHRTRADEAYMVGMRKSPLAGYLDIDRIIQIALDHDVDAIHPGYGFLSENADLARACEENGIAFIGPDAEIIEKMGDKDAARRTMREAGVPIAFGTDAGTCYNYHGAQTVEFGLMVEFGFTPAQTLIAATRTNATMMRWIDRLGTVEAGKLADLAAFDKSPLEDIHAILDCSMTVLGGDVVFEK